MMKDGFRFFEEEAAFECWFVGCVIAGAKNKDCPDEYVWNMPATFVCCAQTIITN